MKIFIIAIKYINKYGPFVGSLKLLIKNIMLNINIDNTVIVADSMYFDFRDISIPIPELINSIL
jgi:hypothetical protein